MEFSHRTGGRSINISVHPLSPCPVLFEHMVIVPMKISFLGREWHLRQRGLTLNVRSARDYPAISALSNKVLLGDSIFSLTISGS